MFLDCHETSSFYFFPERSCGFSQLSDRYLADSILLRSNIAMYLKTPERTFFKCYSFWLRNFNDQNQATEPFWRILIAFRDSLLSKYLTETDQRNRKDATQQQSDNKSVSGKTEKVIALNFFLIFWGTYVKEKTYLWN